jgi:hypothetical protein
MLVFSVYPRGFGLKLSTTRPVTLGLWLLGLKANLKEFALDPNTDRT